MKIDWTYLICVSISAYGCGGSDIKFSEPQPTTVKSSIEFPPDFQFDFATSSDSTIIGYFDRKYSTKPDTGVSIDAKNYIEITDRAIFNHLEGSLMLDFKLLKDSAIKTQFPFESILDTLINDYFNRANYQYDLMSNEDSVLVFNVNLVDTMFYVSKSNVIKKYKKGVFLNIESTKGAWSVYQVLKNNNTLTFNSISNNDEAVLRRLMQVNNEDFEKEIIGPSKKSFNEFLKMKGFENEIELERMSTMAK